MEAVCKIHWMEKGELIRSWSMIMAKRNGENQLKENCE